MPRPYLVYCPTLRGELAADLWAGFRLYDVALNDYSGEGKGLDRAEHRFARVGHKWPCIHANLGGLIGHYTAFCFLDEDIEIDTDRLNRLFLAGEAFGLSLWQAALTPDSYHSHTHLLAVNGSYLRPTGLVEIMMPCFSRQALQRVWNTLTESQSGWGLDGVWSKLLSGQCLAVVDAIQARHGRPCRSEQWTLSNGLTPEQEWYILARKYGFFG